MGQKLCRLVDLPIGTSRGFATRAEALYADIVVVHSETGLYAYRNACPHTGAPMEDSPHHFLDPTGHYIFCAVHGAQFRIKDGYCVSGPCIGRSLHRHTLIIEDGWIITPDEMKRRE